MFDHTTRHMILRWAILMLGGMLGCNALNWCYYLHPCFSAFQPTTAFCGIDGARGEGRIFRNYCEFRRHNTCYQTNYIPTFRKACFVRYPYTRDDYAFMVKPRYDLGAVNKNKG
uniref:Uncharacterized protein n=1 Tax=Cuerna arida TaxID=1464854 RepID=A0A1B6FJB5_9HEMI